MYVCMSNGLLTSGAVAPDDEVENEEHEEDGAREEGGCEQGAALPLLALEGLVQAGRSESSKGTWQTQPRVRLAQR